MIGTAVPVIFMVELAIGVPDITAAPDDDENPPLLVADDSSALLLLPLVTKLRAALPASGEGLGDAAMEVIELVL